MRNTLPIGSDIVRVTLRPLAVSLNSVNGLLHLKDSRRLFFKTHVEPDSVISEYYNAALLAEAGYPILQPLFSSTKAGKQVLVYQLVEDPSFFDVAWKIERGEVDLLGQLTVAQQKLDRQLMKILFDTLAWQSQDDSTAAPIHQLFSHRLVGGRLERFFNRHKHINLLGASMKVGELREFRWMINGQEYDTTLDNLVEEASVLLNPGQAGPSVVGHGDAHNGNVFFLKDGSFLYFDPAFAGRHNPLLDLAKPFFHNVFAMWMYFPAVIRSRTEVQLRWRRGQVQVDHNYELPLVRRMFLRSKVRHVLIPLVRELDHRGWLPSDWRRYFKAALFCCPLLTIDLTDKSNLPPEISILGLANAVEMGAESRGKRSLIDTTLDEVEESLTRR